MNANITADERKFDTNRQYQNGLSWRDVILSTDEQC